ncbi:MAG: hypothetical protein AAFZ15_12405 [Bacteroidota bacterium]
MKILLSFLIFTISQITLFGKKIKVEKRIKKREFPSAAEKVFK